MENALRREYEWDEDLPLEAEDMQASSTASGSGSQQGGSKGEHRQGRLRRTSSSLGTAEVDSEPGKAERSRVSR